MRVGMEREGGRDGERERGDMERERVGMERERGRDGERERGVWRERG